jgi:hypothetical protein
MTRTYLLCLPTHDRAAIHRLAGVLNGHTLLFVDRDAPPFSRAKLALQECVVDADIVLLVAEPSDVETDPLVLYTVGLANGVGKPLWAVSRAPRSAWPADVLAQFDAVMPWPGLADAQIVDTRSSRRATTKELMDA